MALARGLRYRVQVQVAPCVEAGEHLVLGRPARGADLEEGRQADAAQAPGPGRALAARGKALPVREREGLVHDGLEFAAVVGGPVGGRVRHGLGRNEVPAAQLHRVESVLGGGVVDHAFDRVGDVGPPRPAVGGHRRRVRVGDAGVRVHRRDAVHPAHGDGDVAAADLRAEGRGVGADVGAVVETQREEAAVAVQGELAGERERAALVLRQEQLRARRHPLHRAPEFFRGEHDRDVFGEREAADAEASAHVLGDDAQLLARHAGDLGELRAHAVRALRGRVHGDAFGRRVPRGEERARLDRVADQALARDGEPRAQGRAREGRLHRGAVAGFVFEGEVAGRLLVQLRGSRRGGGFESDRGRQVAVLDRDLLGRILREQRALGNDQRHRLAHVVHLPACERRPEGLAHCLPADACEANPALERFPSGLGEVGAREHEMHAAARSRRRGVDRGDLRMRAVGAQEEGVQLPREVPVGGEAALAGQQARIFAPECSFSHEFPKPAEPEPNRLARFAFHDLPILGSCEVATSQNRETYAKPKIFANCVNT